MQHFPFRTERKSSNRKAMENKKSSKNNQNIEHWEKVGKNVLLLIPLHLHIYEKPHQESMY
jgi:hypothetical protein